MLRLPAIGFACALLAGGCSLVFDGSRYEGEARDAGGADGGADAGVDAAAPDAGGVDAGATACRSHRDCLESPREEDYVCVPDGAGAFVCDEVCVEATDCQGIAGGPGHDEGVLCRPTGDCGCATSEHCEDALFPACHRAEQLCVERNCNANMDCIALTPGTYCFGGVCQRITCSSAADCAGEGNAACTAGPMGAGPSLCSDTCALDGDCPTGTTCGVTPPRRCG